MSLGLEKEGIRGGRMGSKTNRGGIEKGPFSFEL